MSSKFFRKLYIHMNINSGGELEINNVGKHHREILTDGLKVLGLRKICMPWR